MLEYKLATWKCNKSISLGIAFSKECINENTTNKAYHCTLGKEVKRDGLLVFL